MVKLKILQLCNKPPLPSMDGGTIAMNNITQGLLSLGHAVDVLTIGTDKHPFDEKKLSKEYKEQTNIQGVYIDTKVNIVDAFSSLITNDSYNITRFFSSDFDRILTKKLESNTYDIIHIESLFMTPYIPTCGRNSKAKLVLRSHNLEYIIWERLAEGENKYYKKTYLKYLSRKLKEYEVSVLNDISGIACISSEDLKKYKSLGCEIPLINIPFGIDYAELSQHIQPKKNNEVSLFHLGAMDWGPNIEAVNWFIDKCWDKIKEKNPNIKFYLAGRNMPENINPESKKGIEIVGEVDNAYKFMNSHDIMIVPLLSAGGIRVKIIEGMALGKAIISTSIGAEGIDYTENTDIIIADIPQEFVETISALISDKNKIAKLGEEAKKMVQTKYDNIKLVQKLVDFYQEISE